LKPDPQISQILEEYKLRIQLDKRLNSEEKNLCLEFLNLAFNEAIKSISMESVLKVLNELDKQFESMTMQEIELVIQQYKFKLNSREIELCLGFYEYNKKAIEYNKKLCPRCNSSVFYVDEIGNENCACLQNDLANVLKRNTGNELLDTLIMRCQINQANRSTKNIIEWVPYENFDNIELISDGKYGAIYFATWLDGPIINWDRDQKFMRVGPRKIALKLLKKSDDPSEEFLEEMQAFGKYIEYNDIFLAREICNGMRPPMIKGIPYGYQEIMRRCWDADPLKRPNAQGIFHYFDTKLKKLLSEEYTIPKLKTPRNLQTHKPSSSIIYYFGDLSKPRNEKNHEIVKYSEMCDGLLMILPTQMDDSQTLESENYKGSFFFKYRKIREMDVNLLIILSTQMNDDSQILESVNNEGISSFQKYSEIREIDDNLLIL
ncbi:35017_t:CDS:2, partial [Racocetra persica]